MSISNRTTGTNRRHHRLFSGRWLVLILAAVLLTFEIAVAVSSYAYVDGLLRPGCATTTVENQKYLAQSIPTDNGYSLPAWWRPGTNGAAVILLPGNGGSRESLLAEADLLAAQGYAVLSLSPRACAGQLSTLGLREAEDLRPVVEYLTAQPGIEWIAVLGFSAGGAAAVLGSVEVPEIRAVIAEGHYRSLDYEIDNSKAVPLSIVLQIQRWVSFWYRLRTDAWPEQVSPIDRLDELQPRPVLLIFGEREAENNGAADQFTAARPPKELWIVPGAGHGGYLQASPQAYPQRIIDFLDNARRNR